MSPSEIDYFLQTAVAHHQAGQRPQAEALFGQILAQHPDHDMALLWLGVLALQVGHYDRAIEHLSRACDLQPTISANHINLGIALAGKKRLDEAAACFRRGLELDPDLADAHNNLAVALQE